MSSLWMKSVSPTLSLFFMHTLWIVLETGSGCFTPSHALLDGRVVAGSTESLSSQGEHHERAPFPDFTSSRMSS